MTKAFLSFAVLLFAVSVFAKPPVTCSTSCDYWTPEGFNSCKKPYLSQERFCTTRCSNGVYHRQIERACIPDAPNLRPLYASGYWGTTERYYDSSTFKSDEDCKGTWWVDVETDINYISGYQHLMTYSWIRCLKDK